MFLEGHHVRHWADGGETSLANTALLCSAHHRYVHEYGYTIELVADHRPLFRDPKGRLVAAVPPARWWAAKTAGTAGTADEATEAAAKAASIPQPGWQWLQAANASLAIDANTIACDWDGSAADYGLLVDHLMTVASCDKPTSNSEVQ